jgi:hypothetical protein
VRFARILFEDCGFMGRDAVWIGKYTYISEDSEDCIIRADYTDSRPRKEELSISYPQI